MRRPLVFIHGIFGSIYVPTLVGKAWGFGPAGYIYDSFIDNLKTLGYTEGKNLFICYYEWWKDIHECVNTLMSKINEAKIKTTVIRLMLYAIAWVVYCLEAMFKEIFTEVM